MGTPPPRNKTPLIPNTCINIVNIMWESGLASKRGGVGVGVADPKQRKYGYLIMV